MRILMVPVLACAALFTSAGAATQQKDVTAQIIALERGALDRWGKGDPGGYQEIYAPEVTYFDPTHDKRVNGLDAIKTTQAPIWRKVHVDRYDMINPKVQRYGDIALLTFNLVSFRTGADAKETIVGRWNSTEVYHATGGTWRIVHVHLSCIKPELKSTVSETRRDQ